MAKRGGRQPGAGRPKGSKSIKRKVTEKIVARFLDSKAETPLEIMLAIMTDAYKRKDIELALKAADMAAPYVHAKLQSVELKGSKTHPVRVQIIDDIG